MKHVRSLYIAQVSLFAATAAVVMAFKIPVFFAPSFYNLDLSETIVLIGSFSLGPCAGVTIEFLKIFIHFLCSGTSTAGVGLFANFLSGLALILPSSIFYRKVRTFRGAMYGMAFGLFSLILVSALLNWLIILPLIVKVLGISMEKIVNIGNKVNPSIVDSGTFILFAVVPFNLVKGLISCALAVPLYKKLSTIIKNMGSPNNP